MRCDNEEATRSFGGLYTSDTIFHFIPLHSFSFREPQKGRLKRGSVTSHYIARTAVYKLRYNTIR
jgi:hypothetical protein